MFIKYFGPVLQPSNKSYVSMRCIWVLSLTCVNSINYFNIVKDNNFFTVSYCFSSPNEMRGTFLAWD